MRRVADCPLQSSRPIPLVIAPPIHPAFSVPHRLSAQHRQARVAIDGGEITVLWVKVNRQRVDLALGRCAQIRPDLRNPTTVIALRRPAHGHEI